MEELGHIMPHTIDDWCAFFQKNAAAFADKINFFQAVKESACETGASSSSKQDRRDRCVERPSGATTTTTRGTECPIHV